MAIVGPVILIAGIITLLLSIHVATNNDAVLTHRLPLPGVPVSEFPYLGEYSKCNDKLGLSWNCVCTSHLNTDGSVEFVRGYKLSSIATMCNTVDEIIVTATLPRESVNDYLIHLNGMCVKSGWRKESNRKNLRRSRAGPTSMLASSDGRVECIVGFYDHESNDSVELYLELQSR
jgi:hypothetical protein